MLESDHQRVHVALFRNNGKNYAIANSKTKFGTGGTIHGK